MKQTRTNISITLRKTILNFLIIFVFCSGSLKALNANAQPNGVSPGAQPYVPSKIDWLTTTMEASLRSDNLQSDGFLLQITHSDSETILIYVRYLPNVNRQAMNLMIDAAKQAIRITAKSYGWDKWLNIKEDVQLGHS